MARISRNTCLILTLALALAGCEDLAEATGTADTLEQAAKTGGVPVLYREF